MRLRLAIGLARGVGLGAAIGLPLWIVIGVMPWHAFPLLVLMTATLLFVGFQKPTSAR